MERKIVLNKDHHDIKETQTMNVAIESRKKETLSENDRELDQVLVTRAQKGDTQAFEWLVKKYQRRIVSVIYKMIPRIDEAHDLSQEVFIKAYRALPDFRAESSFYTWIFRIAVNTAKNHIQSSYYRKTDHLEDMQEDNQNDIHEDLREHRTPERLAISNELNQKIMIAFQSLPEEMSQALLLRTIDGLSYDEIAERMQCPVGTVRSRIFRAREAMEVALEELVK
jgi:RNA polymerase sigma-70 factor, ECF subfamily